MQILQTHYLGLRELYSNWRLDIFYCCWCYNRLLYVADSSLNNMDLFELKVLRQSVSACWATACFRLGTEVIDK